MIQVQPPTLFLLQFFDNLSAFVQNKIFEIVISAFSGGFFAGWFANLFESRRRIFDLRSDKYFAHRNSIVQIEHELTPIRVNLSRDLKSLDIALEETNNTNTRLLLRFYKLSLSSGLNLKLLDLEFINKYLELYSLLESINSDFDYASGLVTSIRESLINRHAPDLGLLSTYIQLLPYLKDKCKQADKNSLYLLSLSKLALRPKDDQIRRAYLKDGKDIRYSMGKKSLTDLSDKLIKEENLPFRKGEARPKFFAPYLDVRRVIATS